MAKKKKTLSKQERVHMLFKNISRLNKIIGTQGNQVMGIDPGRTSPGIAFEGMAGGNGMKKFTKNTKLKGFGKVLEVESWMLFHLKGNTPGLAMMEDYAFDSEWGREKAGEMGGVIKRQLWIRSLPVLTVAPQSIKAFIGVMRKEEIMKEVLRKYNINTSKSDEADAVVLVKMGLGIIEIIRAGMNIADDEERKRFEANPHTYTALSKQEGKTLVNLLISRGEETYEFSRCKKETRKAKGKQKQIKDSKNTDKNSNSETQGGTTGDTPKCAKCGFTIFFCS